MACSLNLTIAVVKNVKKNDFVGTLLKILHGFAPSATINIRREPRLTSRWSLCAKSDQCMSLDFTSATRAADKRKINKKDASTPNTIYIIMALSNAILKIV